MIPSAWFAIHARPSAEKVVRSRLDEKQIESFWPSYTFKNRKRETVEKALFPGYLFARFAPEERRADVLSITQVVRILSDEQHQPIAIPDAEVSAIRELLAAGVGVMPWRTPVPGEFVDVVAGPLRGQRGKVVRVPKSGDYLIVQVSLFHSGAAAKIDLESVRPVERKAA